MVGSQVHRSFKTNDKYKCALVHRSVCVQKIRQYGLDIISSFRDNRIIHLPPALAYHPSLEVTPTKQLFIFNIFLKICGQRFSSKIILIEVENTKPGPSTGEQLVV